MIESRSRRIRIGTRTFVMAEHAIDRYGERVRPGLDGDRGVLFEEMRRVLLLAEVTTFAPAWVLEKPATDGWVALDDAIAFPIVRGVLTTCLTRSQPGDETRVVRTERRRERTANDGRPGARKKHGKVARSERASRARRREEALD